MDPVSLTQSLLAFDTTNPPGHERACALFLANILRDAGFDVLLDDFEPNRANVIARLPGRESDAPFVMTGHLDTVPFGRNPWMFEPLSGAIQDGKLYGRGASDMKSGVAAIVCAALEIAATGGTKHGLALVLTSGEEVGCRGAGSLVARGHHPGNASALLVAEPTSNQPALGHKGAFFMHGRTTGVTAHSSMPHLGVNAIYKAARAIGKIEDYRFTECHPFLGAPTINVGMVSGGMNVNSVPDAAAFTMDVRSVAGQEHQNVLRDLRECLGSDVRSYHLPPSVPGAKG